MFNKNFRLLLTKAIILVLVFSLLPGQSIGAQGLQLPKHQDLRTAPINDPSSELIRRGHASVTGLQAATALMTGTITIWHDYPSGSADESALNQVIQNAQADNPGLTIDAVYHSDLLSDYNTAAQAGVGPDIYIGPSDNVGYQAYAHYILKLDGYLTGKLNNITQSAIDGMKVDGHIYGIPKDGNVVALYYNKSLMPTPPSSTTELLSMIQGGKTISSPIGGSYFFYGFWNAFGGQLMDNTGRCIADQGGVEEAMQYLLDLQTAGASLEIDYGTAEAKFLNGEVDMLINGSWALSLYESVLGSDLGVIALPAGPSGNAHAFTDPDGFFINSNTSIPAKAVNLALYMTNQTSAQIFTNVSGKIPVRTDVTASDPLINTFAQIFAQGYPRPKLPELLNYWNPFNKMAARVLGGIETPLVGIQRACNTMNVLNGFAPGTNTVTMWYPYEKGSGEENALLQVVDNALAADETLTIVPIQVPFVTLFTEYEAAVSSNGGPDMFIGPNDRLGNQVQAGLVRNIDTELQGRLTNVNQSAIDGMKVNGMMYGIPESAKAVALYYNKSMISTPPTTTSELLSLVQGGDIVVTDGMAGSYYFYGFWNAFGGQLMDDLGRCIADQGGFVPAMQYLSDLQTAGAVFQVDYATATSMFLNGDAAMQINGPWILPEYKSALGADLGAVILPIGPSGSAKPLSGFDGIYINPNTTNLNHTIDLALFMTSQASSQIMTDAGGHIPVRSDVISIDPLVNLFSQASAQGDSIHPISQLSNYWVPFNNMITDVLQGTITPFDGVQRACLQMNQLNSGPKPSIPVLQSPLSGKLLDTLQPTLDWKETVPTAHHFQIQVSTNNNFTALVIDETDLTTSEFTLSSDLDPGTRYYWRVRAYNLIGNTKGWSEIWNFRTPLDAPTLGTPACGASLLTDRPAFDWLDVEGAASYTIQVSPTTSFGTLLLNTAITPSNYQITKDLPQNKTLYWRVKAQTSVVSSPWSLKCSFTTGNPPTVPVLASPANNALLKDYTPTLKWYKSSVPAGTLFKRYELQLDNNSDFSSPEIEFSTTDGILTETTFTPPSDLAPNMKYYWRVRAVNLVGADEHASGWSAVRSFRTVMLPPTLLLPADGSTEVSLKPFFDWEDVEGATSYTIQISTSASFSTYLVNTKRTVSDFTPSTNLPKNKVIYWRVRANGPNGPSAWSVFQFTTPP